MTDREHIEAIARAFNDFMRQLELGDHKDSLDHPVLRNARLTALRDSIVRALPGVDVISMDDARAIAHRNAQKLGRRP